MIDKTFKDYNLRPVIPKIDILEINKIEHNF